MIKQALKTNSLSLQSDTTRPQSKAIAILYTISKLFPNVSTSTRDKITKAQVLYIK